MKPDLKSVKAIVSDFDGTLVGADRKVSRDLKIAVGRFISSGKVFSIATGRAYEGYVESASKQLDLSHLNIVRGGSEIIDSKTNKIVWGKYIDPNLLESLFNNLFAVDGVIVLAESGPDLYTKDGISNKEFSKDHSVKDIKDIPKNNVPKVAIPPLYSPTTIVPVYEDLLKKYPTLSIVKTTSKDGMGMDINDGGAGKHLALLQYSKLMNILPEYILGVGDSYNDLPLLTACGVKVAMGNAPQELKEVADIIIGTQEEGGLVNLINQINSL